MKMKIGITLFLLIAMSACVQGAESPNASNRTGKQTQGETEIPEWTELTCTGSDNRYHTGTYTATVTRNVSISIVREGDGDIPRAEDEAPYPAETGNVDRRDTKGTVFIDSIIWSPGFEGVQLSLTFFMNNDRVYTILRCD